MAGNKLINDKSLTLELDPGECCQKFKVACEARGVLLCHSVHSAVSYTLLIKYFWLEFMTWALSALLKWVPASFQNTQGSLLFFSEPYVIFSGGMSYEASKSPCLTIMHGKSVTVLEMEHQIIDFIVLCNNVFSYGKHVKYEFDVLCQGYCFLALWGIKPEAIKEQIWLQIQILHVKKPHGAIGAICGVWQHIAIFAWWHGHVI